MKWMLMVLVIVTLALPGSWAAAQEDEGDPEFNIEFEFVGTVVSIDEVGILVDVEGIEFFLAPAGSFNPSQLNVGDLVRFNGVMLNDETIKVSELEIVEDTAEEPVDDPEDDSEGEDDEDSATCDKEDHPVIVALADSFELEAAVVAGYFCDGNGVGEVARALTLAEQTGLPVADIFAMREDGMGWGNIVKELGVSPSSLAPGRIVSAEKKEAKQEEKEQNKEEEKNNGEGQSQEQNKNEEKNENGPGNSANAPGQQKKNDDPGNSSNAPGQKKKK